MTKLLEGLKLRNLKVTCSWNGQNFAGYQIQPHIKTVESELTKAWNTLTRDSTKIVGCSRLDAGVHAKQYVFNVKSKTKLSTESLVKSLNGILRDNGHDDISIYQCEDVDKSFHARFSSTGKHYRYLIWHGIGEHAFYRNISWNVRTPHSLELLEPILKIFEGTHNFNSYRASDCGSQNPTKTIYQISVKRHEQLPELHIVDIIGDGFLKNMIRNLIGAGMLVIKEKRTIKDLQERLESGKKSYNYCAPGHALTLMKVYYLPMQNVENIDS